VAAHYEKTGDHKASLDTLKKLVDLDPDNVASRIRLGEQYARQDDLVEAVAELRRAAQYLQRNGRSDDYLRVAERISHLDQADTGLAKELAEHFLSRGDSKRALAKLQICFKASPRDLGTLQMLARAFQDLGQTSKTLSVLKELARVHADGGRHDDARRVYAQAAELAPDDPEVTAALQSIESDRPAARPAAVRAPSLQAQAPRAAAGSAPRAGPAGAPQTMRIAQPPPPPAITPPPPRASDGRINAAAIPKLLKETEVYVKYGLHEKAIEHLRKIFAADPDNVEAHEKAKMLATATGRTAEAVTELTALVRLYGERGDPRAEKARKELRGLKPQQPALDEDEPLELGRLEEELEAAPEVLGGVVQEFSEAEVEELPQPEVELELEEEVIAEPELPPAAAARGAGDAFDGDLAEADFYIQSGLVEEARAILEAILMGEPGK